MHPEPTPVRRTNNLRRYAFAIGSVALVCLVVFLVVPVSAEPVPEVGAPELLLTVDVTLSPERPTDPKATCHGFASARLSLAGVCADNEYLLVSNMLPIFRTSYYLHACSDLLLL